MCEHIVGRAAGGEGGVSDVEDEFVAEFLKGRFLTFYDEFGELGGGIGHDEIMGGGGIYFMGVGF